MNLKGESFLTTF